MLDDFDGMHGGVSGSLPHTSSLANVEGLHEETVGGGQGRENWYLRNHYCVRQLECFYLSLVMTPLRDLMLFPDHTAWELRVQATRCLDLCSVQCMLCSCAGVCIFNSLSCVPIYHSLQHVRGKWN